MTDKLYLFDIDGTLIHAGKTPSMIFVEVISRVIEETVSFPKGIFFGRTDTYIINEMLKRYRRLPSDGFYHKIRDLFIETMKSKFPRSTDGFIIPGAPAFLDRLQKDPSVTLGLVTGNFRETAYVKLEHFGLHTYFSAGGFGDHAEDRPKLVQDAVREVSRLVQKRFSPEHITVIGDTVHDIRSAHYWGYRSVAISYIRDKEELLQEEPDLLTDTFESLIDNGSVYL